MSTSALTSNQPSGAGSALRNASIMPEEENKGLQGLLCLDLLRENRENARLFGTLGPRKRLWLRSSAG